MSNVFHENQTFSEHIQKCCNVLLFAFQTEIDRYIGLADMSADIWILRIYLYRPRRLILSASVGVDKTLLYSSRIHTICARKDNEACQDSYLTARLASALP